MKMPTFVDGKSPKQKTPPHALTKNKKTECSVDKNLSKGCLKKKHVLPKHDDELFVVFYCRCQNFLQKKGSHDGSS